MRKKSTHVEIPEGILSESQYQKLLNYAYNSSVWYVTHYVRCAAQVRVRLQHKGYVPVTVNMSEEDGEVKDIDIIDLVIKRLENEGFLNDEDYADTRAETLHSRGKSITMIRISLQNDGVPQDIISSVISKFSDDSALNKSFQKVIQSSAYQKEKNEYGRKQRIVKSLLTRGFSYGEIKEFLDNHLPEVV